jgi:hypothetical protein
MEIILKRCTIIIPDAGPFNSLWVADQLPLLISLDMKIIVLDVVYDEMKSDPDNYQKDKDVKNFIDNNQPPFVIETTEKGVSERLKVLRGEKRSKNAGDVAITDFMTSETGLTKYLSSKDPVAVLFEDSDIPMVSFRRKPPNLHLLSTVAMLRGLEELHIIESADAIINEMQHPSKPDRRGRKFIDLPCGTDEPAAIGSSCKPR